MKLNYVDSSQNHFDKLHHTE